MRTSLLALVLAMAAGAPGQQRTTLPPPASGNVTVPLDEYNKLLELAARPARKPELPPLPYAVKHAQIELKVAGESVSGVMQFEGEVFRAGDVKVPLVSGLTVSDARHRGRDLPLQQEGGAHAVVLPGPAEFSVELESALPLSIEAGRASFNLPVPAAGTVGLTLVIPGDHTNVSIKPGLITRRSSSGGQTAVEAILVPGQPSAAWWTMRETAAPAAPREVRFLSDVKTLVSVSEAQLAMAALADITVVQGEPAQFELAIPAGFEVTEAAGASLESSEVQSGVLILKVGAARQRTHQFLIALERPVSAAEAEAPILGLKAAQRETGEVLVEAEGTMELTAKEGGGLKRMDPKETNPYLRALAHYSPQAAFRFHRQPGQSPGLSLAWVRFPESGMLAAVAQQAVVTTLVTSEGRSLTEVRLVLRNQAQPFLKVALPAGADIVSADIAGESVKPVQGPDGSRVPLLRPGFRPADSYPVSFVFTHAGAPFAKRGDSELVLPRMDVAIASLHWEVFLPERFRVRDFGGDALAAGLLSSEEVAVMEPIRLGPVLPGQLGGDVVDPSGAAVPGVNLAVVHLASGRTLRAATDAGGRWTVSGLLSGRVRVTVDRAGFRQLVREIDYDAARPSQYRFELQVGSVAETIEVQAESVGAARQPRKEVAAQQAAPSANVLNLQRRVAGVLPIPVDVPRAGQSFRFARPLVIDEETKLRFSYRSR